MNTINYLHYLSVLSWDRQWVQLHDINDTRSMCMTKCVEEVSRFPFGG